jgi:CheY-like chemotaxis protein
MSGVLTGRRVLVVEDSPVVAPFTKAVLDDLGCVVAGPATNMADARSLAETEQIDAALIDIRIRGEKAFAICDILAARDVPFVLTSGYADWPVPDEWKDRPQLPKPYTPDDLERALSALLI